MQFYCPQKNLLSALFLDIKLFLPWKRKAPFQITYAIGKVWLRQFCLALRSQHNLILSLDNFFCLALGSQHNLILALELFNAWATITNNILVPPILVERINHFFHLCFSCYLKEYKVKVLRQFHWNIPLKCSILHVVDIH